MKTLIPLIVTIAVGCASHAEPKFAQPVPPPPPPPEDVFVVAQAPAPKALPAPAVKPVPPTAPVLQMLQGVHADLARAHGDAVRAHAEAWNVPFKLGSSSSSRRTLVIPKGEANPGVLADAEEDLNVMTLILEKALEQRSDDEGRKALGIDVFGSSSGIRNLLIEGHGAIFTLKSKIALVPPPPATKKEETKTKEERSSEWDDARRQLYGPSEIEKEIHRAFKHVQTSFSSSEEYDEKKLQRLKESLTEALKSASNIRHLSGDHTVTVVVLSSSPVAEVRKVVAEAGRGGGRGGEGGRGGSAARIYEDKFESRSSSRMMLQAKKSDIDSYAKGKLNTDAFRDKVKIQIY